MIAIFSIILGYLLGSIPFGFVLTRFAGMGDIRKIGSGNIGATNVLRTGNKKLAALTLLLDGVKGVVAVLIAKHMAPGFEPFAGFAAFIGHVYPAWLKFKGGKGVATAVGILTALCWPVGVSVMVLWMIIARITNYSSLAALVSIAWSPVAMCFFGRSDITWLALAVAIMIFWTHRANIQRLRDGTESKIK